MIDITHYTCNERISIRMVVLWTALIAAFCVVSPPGAIGQPDIHSLAVPSHGRIVAVGEAGTILVSSDAGESWSPATKPPTGNAGFYDVYFRDSLHGLVAGGGGFVLATSDGGGTWDTLPRITTKTLFSIGFGSGDAGWCVGASGTIIATTDGGRTWFTQNSLSYNDLRSIGVGDSGVVIVTGSRGTILRTSNGGNDWFRSQSGVKSFLYSLDMSGERHSWAVGGYGSILRSTDAGITWEKQNLKPGTLVFKNPRAFYHAVGFRDTINGIVAGSLGVLLRTTNGGIDWIPGKTLPDIHTFSLLLDTPPGTSWLSGSGGAIFRSDDGGSTWEKKHPPLPNE